jgi:hypothetical protein
MLKKSFGQKLKTGDFPAKIRANTLKYKILQYADKKRQGFRYFELSSEGKIYADSMTISATLAMLVSIGYLAHPQRGFYRITQKGILAVLNAEKEAGKKEEESREKLYAEKKYSNLFINKKIVEFLISKGLKNVESHAYTAEGQINEISFTNDPKEGYYRKGKCISGVTNTFAVTFYNPNVNNKLGFRIIEFYDNSWKDFKTFYLDKKDFDMSENVDNIETFPKFSKNLPVYSVNEAMKILKQVLRKEDYTTKQALRGKEDDE